MLMQTEHPNYYDPTSPDFPFRRAVSKLTANSAAEMLRYGRSKPGVLSLAQGEGCAKTPDFIVEAAHKSLDDGKSFYGPALGFPELRQEVSNYYTGIYNLNIPTSRIFVTGSGTTAMHLALTGVLNEDDEVVAVTPIWKNLLGAVELTQAHTRQVPLEETETGWQLNLEKLFAACTTKTKVILIVSPSNPTGWMASRSEIREILEFARARGIWIISDEVYGRTTYDSVHAPSFLEEAEADDLLFTVNSFSKTWAMTGWRLGWLVGPAAAEGIVRDIALYDNLCPPSFTQFGAIAALRYGEEFITQQIALWRKNRDTLMAFYQQYPRIIASRPHSTFYSMFRLSGEDDCMSLGRKLIDEAGLSLAPGGSFGMCAKGYMRMCFAISESKLDDALSRLAKVAG